MLWIDGRFLIRVRGFIRVSVGASPMVLVYEPPHHGSMTDDSQRSEQPVETTTPAAQPPATRRLTRRTDGKMIGGVAAGLGDYFGVDPVIFRIGFVIAAFAGGAGILAYLLAWVIIPESATGTSEANRALRAMDKDRTRTWLGVGLLVLGSLMLLDQLGSWNPALLWGVALIAVGVILFRTDPTKSEPIETGEPAVPTAEPAAAEAPPPVVRRERSVLGWLGAGTALIAVGIASMLVEADWITLDFGQLLGIALAVLGASLILGAWLGRARALIFIGLLLLPLAFVSTVVDAPFDGGVGERSHTPQSVDEVKDEYRLGAGEMSIDFSDVDFSGQSISTEASVVAGSLKVIVPSDVTVDVNGHVGVGEIHLFGRSQDGAELEANSVVRGSPVGGTLNLDLETSLGEIVVARSPGLFE
jgi:phage shock protein PspC (stress-responsive transcriptional regulator)